MYDKEINPRLDKVLGYMYFCDVDHPLASKGGKVYHHRHVASIKIGRWLTSDEHVHHVDGDKTNNNPDNLEIISQSEHAALHNPLRERITITCQNCGVEFEYPVSKAEGRKFCSIQCANEVTVKTRKPRKKSNKKKNKRLKNTKSASHKKSREKIKWPSDEELAKLVWEIPRTKLAKQLGVSDKAIAKRCKSRDISQPPRGYWAKIRSKSPC